MNNTRKTINFLLSDIADSLNFALVTGDEVEPTSTPPLLILSWLTGQTQGKRPESRQRLLQLTILVGDQDTDTAENACEQVLKSLKLNSGSHPTFVTPKLDFTNGPPGIPSGTVVEISQLDGWQKLKPPESTSRFYALTLVVDYTPD